MTGKESAGGREKNWPTMRIEELPDLKAHAHTNTVGSLMIE